MTSARDDLTGGSPAHAVFGHADSLVETLEQLRQANATLRARVAELEPVADEAAALRAERDEALRQNEERRQAGRALDREAVQLRAMLAEAERQLGNIRQTFVYRIGEAIVSARTWKGLRQLPRRLIALRRAYLEKRGLLAPPGAPRKGLSERLRYAEEARSMIATEGFEAALAFVRAAPARDTEEKARALVELAHAIHPQDPARAASLAVEAGYSGILESRLRSLVLALFDHGEVDAPALILATLGDVMTANAGDRARRETILAQERQLATPLQFPPRAPVSAIAGGPRRLAVVAPRSLPHDADADTFRAQAVVEAAHGAGFEALLVTQPGYQYPRPGDGEPALRSLGSTRVARLPEVSAPAGVFDQYAAETGMILGKELKRQGIRHVHALAHPPLASAALWAARTAGATFTLDIGELPASGSHVDADWTGRERFRAGLSLLAALARSADRVIVRSRAVAEALSERGLDVEARIVEDVLPASTKRAPDADIAVLRGMLGLTDEKIVGVFESIDSDEGLGDLLRALPTIRRAEPRAIILFLGSGPGVEALRQRAVMLGVGSHVLMASDFTRSAVSVYLSGFSVAAFPKRRPFSPGLAAPFELQAALACGAPVVAADVPWAREWIDDGATGLLTSPGDSDALAAAVIRLLADPALAARIGAAGHRIARERSGRASIDPQVVATFQAFAPKATAGNDAVVFQQSSTVPPSW